MANNYAKTPAVFQMEATECGAASLSMIFAYYGKHLPLEQMRIETGVSRDGCNAKNILKAARKFGFEAKGYRKDMDGLLAMKPPCIIHWNFNHFVVWEGVKGNDYYINDPAVGRRKLTYEDIDNSFTGIVLTFQKTDAFQKTKEQKTLFSFIKQRLSGQYTALLALFALGLCLVFPGLLIPIFSEVFIDDILVNENTDWMTALLVLMGGTVIFKYALTYYRGMMLQKLQNKMALISAHKFLSHMFRLPISFFDQRYSGDLANRVDNNNNVSTFLSGELGETILNLFIAVFYLILLLLYSPVLTLILVLSVAINLTAVKLGADSMEQLTMKLQQDQGKLIGTVYAGLGITSTLKASGTENEYVSKIEGSYARTIDLEQKMGKKQELLNAIPELADKVSNVIILAVGGLFVIKGQMTVGMLTAYTSLTSSFVEPVNSLAGFAQKIKTLKADMRRVDDIMNYQEDEKFKVEETENLGRKLNGDVTLKDISFGYSILEKPLVEDFGFELKSGSSIAFVGGSGCGKSTVTKIVSGLYLPWTGEVCFDGIPVSHIAKDVLSCSVSTVSQEITLFSGSIKDNLTLWNKSIMDVDIVRAAKDACIHDVITQKPGAYDFHLSEGGTNFSGGQRQRLEIARALVTNPSILIMDEATSALDPIVEKQIIDNIKRRGCTCIIVAHRLSAIRDCDEILVMDHGKIVQRGTHDELAAVEGHYQRLIRNS